MKTITGPMKRRSRKSGAAAASARKSVALLRCTGCDSSRKTTTSTMHIVANAARKPKIQCHEPMTRPRTIVRRATCVSALDAEHLLQRVQHLHEVGLVRHHLVDALVGAGDLVQHAAVLAADDALRLRFQILDGESLLRCVTAHPA